MHFTAHRADPGFAEHGPLVGCDEDPDGDDQTADRQAYPCGLVV